MTTERGWVMAIIAAVALGAAGATRASPSAATAEPPAVLILYFANHTGDARYDPLGKGLADMLLTDLAAVEGIRLVERARLQELVGEIRAQQSSYFDADTAQRFGQLVGAQFAVTGALAAAGDELRIDLRLVEVATGEVLLTEKVVGSPERFFELEAELVRDVVVGLDRTAVLHQTSGTYDLDGALALGQALDAADRGDLDVASRALAPVVAGQPGFQLAQQRYTEILRQLMAARERREVALSGLRLQLQERVDAELAAGADLRKLDLARARRHLGYRVLQGNLFLAEIEDRLEPPLDEHTPRPVAPGKRDEVLDLVRRYDINTRAYVGELRRFGEAHPDVAWTDVEGVIDDADEDVAEQAGCGDTAGSWSFANPCHVATDEAQFLFLGEPDYYGDLNFVMTPTPVQLDPSLEAVAFDLLEGALAGVEQLPEEDRSHHGARVLNVWGVVLNRRGRTAEAIARWQMILDRYPTHEDYAVYEGKIRDALGAAP